MRHDESRTIGVNIQGDWLGVMHATTNYLVSLVYYKVNVNRAGSVVWNILYCLPANKYIASSNSSLHLLGLN